MMTTLTHEAHHKRHLELHASLDELVADYVSHHPDTHPSHTTVFKLMKWSHEQTLSTSGVHDAPS